LAQHGDVGLLLDQAAQSIPQQLMIVDDQRRYGFTGSRACRANHGHTPLFSGVCVFFRPYAMAEGIRTQMVTPSPGAEWILSFPPILATRSFMPTRPRWPRVMAVLMLSMSSPTPSSTISIARCVSV